MIRWLRWCLVMPLLVMGTTAVAAPKAKLIQYWQTHSNQTFVIDHVLWQTFLRKFVVDSADGVNRVAYARVEQSDKSALARYIRLLADTDPHDLRRPEQLAYWLNFYNALTVDLILDNYPVDSIRDIGGGVFSRGPWDDDIITVNGRILTLNDIEHGILRPIWQDPRIHYAINCASIGCPNLLQQAYTADNTEQLMDAAARQFINHRRAVSFINNQLQLSSIYAWYAVDFGSSIDKVLQHIDQYAAPKLHWQLQQLQIADIDADYGYDWSLNDLDTPY